MCVHDLIVEEFEHTKSLSALVYLIERGRELEFSIHPLLISVLYHSQLEKHDYIKVTE